MQKLKLFSSLILPILSCLLLSGCSKVNHTYSKEKVAESIISLCKKEYSIEPRVWLTRDTVWVYIPLDRLVSKENMQWDQKIVEKINKVALASSRVVLSMRPRPKFLAMVSSDIKELGIEYIMYLYIEDIVKYQLQVISRDEFTRRNIINIKENPAALNDTNGTHFEKVEIKMRDFVAAQIAQRITNKFVLEKDAKDYYKSEDVEVLFLGDTLRAIVNIKEIKPPPGGSVDIEKETYKVIAHVIKAYDYKNFEYIEFENPASKQKILFNKYLLKERI